MNTSSHTFFFPAASTGLPALFTGRGFQIRLLWVLCGGVKASMHPLTRQGVFDRHPGKKDTKSRLFTMVCVEIWQRIQTRVYFAAAKESGVFCARAAFSRRNFL
jgi:hypothetical protein